MRRAHHRPRDLPGLPATTLADGVADTMDRFAALHAEGRLPTEDLEA